jgi:hypothetical protein
MWICGLIVAAFHDTSEQAAIVGRDSKGDWRKNAGR